jgi:hypothetical protein
MEKDGHARADTFIVPLAPTVQPRQSIPIFLFVVQTAKAVHRSSHVQGRLRAYATTLREGSTPSVAIIQLLSSACAGASNSMEKWVTASGWDPMGDKRAGQTKAGWPGVDDLRWSVLVVCKAFERWWRLCESGPQSSVCSWRASVRGRPKTLDEPLPVMARKGALQWTIV